MNNLAIYWSEYFCILSEYYSVFIDFSVMALVLCVRALKNITNIFSKSNKQLHNQKWGDFPNWVVSVR